MDHTPFRSRITFLADAPKTAEVPPAAPVTPPMASGKMKIVAYSRKGMIRIDSTGMSARLYANRSQAGMAFTKARSKHPVSAGSGGLRVSSILVLRGSLDDLAGGIRRRHHAKIETVTITVYRMKRNAK